MIILHICSITNRKDSGISVVVPKHFICQSKIENCRVALMNCNVENNFALRSESNVFSFSEIKEIDNLPTPFNHPDIVVFHGVYFPCYLSIYKKILKRKIPYIIVPHGSLTENAQNIKKIKKKLANFFLFNPFIRKASAIQYLSEMEKENSCLFDNRSFVCGNGIEDHLPKKFVMHDGLKLVYIGRYSIYAKGIDILIDFASKNKDFLKSNRILIELYGKGDDGIDKVIKLVKESGCSNLIAVNGPVFDKDKEDVLKQSDFFIQLSRTEGQPLSIMESMAYGIPVIVSEGTTFKRIVEDSQCGIIFDDVSICEKLRNVVCNRKLIAEMGNNSYLYSKNHFSWSIVSMNTIENYKNIIACKR